MLSPALTSTTVASGVALFVSTFSIATDSNVPSGFLTITDCGFAFGGVLIITLPSGFSSVAEAIYTALSELLCPVTPLVESVSSA